MTVTAVKQNLGTNDEDGPEIVMTPRRTTEMKTVDEKTGAAKGVKLARFDLIPPKCIWELAEHYGKGSIKYADRNWEKGYDWSKSYGALGRHLLLFWMGEDIDQETGSHHLIAVAWHAFCLRTFFETHPELDSRPKIAIPPEMPELGDLEDMFWEKMGGKPGA